MKKWDVSFSKGAAKSFFSFDKHIQLLIQSWIEKTLINTDDPRLFGKPLSGNLKGLWRYRIGDYRLICSIHDTVLTIVIIRVGHRREVYK